MAGVVVADLKGYFVHRHAAVAQHASGVVQARVHDVAIDGVAVDLFESGLEAVLVEAHPKRELLDGGRCLPLVQDDCLGVVNPPQIVFVFKEGAGCRVGLAGVKVVTQELEYVAKLRHTQGVVAKFLGPKRIQNYALASIDGALVVDGALHVGAP